MKTKAVCKYQWPKFFNWKKQNFIKREQVLEKKRPFEREFQGVVTLSSIECPYIWIYILSTMTVEQSFMFLLCYFICLTHFRAEFFPTPPETIKKFFLYFLGVLKGNGLIKLINKLYTCTSHLPYPAGYNKKNKLRHCNTNSTYCSQLFISLSCTQRTFFRKRRLGNFLENIKKIMLHCMMTVFTS